MPPLLTHGNDCAYRLGHDCTCGFDEQRRPARLFVSGARAETRQRDWHALRQAIRGRADHEEIERLWDRCERWVVTIPPATSAAKVPTALTPAQLDDACLSHRHDFGLLSADEREDRRREAADWWRCFNRALGGDA